MGCKGLHCDGCGSGGGGAAAAVIALLVIIGVAARKAWPQIVHVVDIAAWTVAGVTGAAILTTGGVLTARVVRGCRARRVIRQATYRATVIPAARLIERPTIEPPATRPALSQPPQRQPGAWPLAGSWQGTRPRIGGDGDEHRTR
jgi:hypothetical protein